MTQFATLLLADARLPVGGHTQSAGLEAAIMAGLGPADVPAYLEMRLSTTGLVDAATAVVALAALRGSGVHLDRVHRHWAARTPSHVQRAAAEQSAHGYLRLARRLGPERPVPAAATVRPLAVAVLADVLGLSGSETATCVMHDEIQTVTSASLKLLPLDPVQTVEWALRAHPRASAIAAQAADLIEPADIPCPSAPLSEVWIDRHARTERRLFHA